MRSEAAKWNYGALMIFQKLIDQSVAELSGANLLGIRLKFLSGFI